MGHGAESDFADFYAATWPRTLACTYALTGERGAAEEIAQEAYVKAWSHWGKVSTYDQPAAWVRQVATRLAVSRWRRSKIAATWLSRNRGEPVAAPPDETTTALVQALLRIPEAQRRAIVLHHHPCLTSTTSTPASSAPSRRSLASLPTSTDPARRQPCRPPAGDDVRGWARSRWPPSSSWVAG